MVQTETAGHRRQLYGIEKFPIKRVLRQNRFPLQCSDLDSEATLPTRRRFCVIKLPAPGILDIMQMTNVIWIFTENRLLRTGDAGVSMKTAISSSWSY
jgi:hypothetical protein